MESEYIAQARYLREALGVQKLLLDFALEVYAVDLRVDNLGVISTTEEFKTNATTKHIDTAYHLTRDGAVKLSYVPTPAMAANGLTKALCRAKMRAMLGRVLQALDAVIPNCCTHVRCLDGWIGIIAVVICG